MRYYLRVRTHLKPSLSSATAVIAAFTDCSALGFDAPPPAFVVDVFGGCCCCC
jgi:hypothetical protein